jgi:hypothetical protein
MVVNIDAVAFAGISVMLENKVSAPAHVERSATD